MVPNSPCSKYNKRIKSLPYQPISGAAASFLPPSMEGQLCRLRGQYLKTDLSEQIEPKFSYEDTLDKEMVNSLFFLVIERTIFRMRQPATCQVISRPTLVVHDQPHKEATLRLCLRFPDSFPWSKKSRTQKNPSYADLAEYCPLEESLDMCLSSTSGCSWKSNSRSHRWR